MDHFFIKASRKLKLKYCAAKFATHNWNAYVLLLFFMGLIGKGQEYWEEEKINEEMPACRQMFNIFHPFDPVAYRFSLDVFRMFVKCLTLCSA